ncbi:MAG: hypothetical protein HOW73_01445, partial [Polyangiaceae bacterium]|nr:hypothetical protein [Polyangiaceae bacterium]
MSTMKTKLIRGVEVVTLLAGIGSLALAFAPEAHAQNCASSNPADWPAPAKPYFLLMVDTSGSMTDSVGSNTSCTVGSTNFGSDRRAHARCAVRNTLLAFAGQANFGLATFARRMTNCQDAGGVCNFGTCSYANFSGNANGTSCDVGCGPEPSPNGDSSTRASANIVVPMLQDIGSPASNVSTLLGYVDGSCADSREIFADGCTPLNGMLRDAFRYYSNQWVPPSPVPGGATLTSPLTTAAAGERACRSVNVILLTDGDETCDSQANAVDAAGDLLAGFTKDGISWSVKTHVINFAGGSVGSTDAIAAAGGTGTSYLANNETELSLALSSIIAGSIAPEECNNGDDNCNGCIDEGYVHYCNVQQQCCSWNTQAQRTTCLNNYIASLNSNPPDGNLTLLPCTTAAQQAQPANWLCYNPGDQCDNVDNNCTAGADEGTTKCGNPPHCPTAETCNGLDEDCDGTADEGGVCPNQCTPSAEVCDGCDNDCDGMTDDGIAAVACGLAAPPNCAGTLSCSPPQPVPPGGCIPGGGFGTCNNNPQSETCDGIDNDCDGVPDDSVPPTSCVPPGTPGGLVYGGTSQCVMGQRPCGGTCQGFIGPSAEICDGIDNDCDGTVDENPFGVGQQCGSNFPPCTPGLTACVNGAIVCQGGVGPQPEQCDGIDNNCNGTADEAPLVDAPPPGQNGCWPLPGNCCTHDNLSWCPPPGGTCNGVGTLTQPCNTGTLTCSGSQGWVCQGGTPPAAEVCDGVDNDCDAVPDDGSFPTEGQACGNPTPPCQQGVIDCTNGSLDCVGDTPPGQEICNGIDDNCDGTIDNGIPIGGPCVAEYDELLYPGDRDNPPCQPGHFECDGNGGLTCVGGVGPNPEVCDGIDNDCDGTIDETGVAPDGINGSENPFPPPDAAIGEVCGTDEGACTEGAWACVNGQFACLGSQGPQVEICDCNDNDCNGVPDNHNPNDNPPLCGEGSDCVAAAGSCQCAAPCSSGEFKCPAGQVCQEVTSSETGEVLGDYCIADNCGDCSTKTNTDVDGNVLCAPAGSQGANCADIPECVCKGQNGCQPPCFGATCSAPLVCTNIGEHAGECVVDNCFNLGCPNCGEVCTDLAECIQNPCTDDSCPPNEVCKPSDDFLSFSCVPSCANVDCKDGTICQDGVCVPSCDPACEPGNVCDLSQDPPTCVPDQCTPESCPNGGCCDSFTGACGACPCEGVICPDEQTCENGECVLGGEGGGGAGGAGGGSEGGGGSTNAG